ncbi:unnamed protein product [Amoebophrya sp. A25]|nr:unnamed protein product [Amoebophrya sp. A25]|eukprot:GSA25T00027021001.1
MKERRTRLLLRRQSGRRGCACPVVLGRGGSCRWIGSRLCEGPGHCPQRCFLAR